MKCLSVASLMAIEAAVKNRLIRWGILAKDTTINESFRRYLIDQSLTFDSDNPALLMPHNFTKWRSRSAQCRHQRPLSGSRQGAAGAKPAVRNFEQTVRERRLANPASQSAASGSLGL